MNQTGRLFYQSIRPVSANAWHHQHSNILNALWQLSGVIAAQPVIETVLAVICILMYIKDADHKADAPL